MYFDINKYDINVVFKINLDKLVFILVEYLDINVLVVGYIDSVGVEEYNMIFLKNRV